MVRYRFPAARNVWLASLVTFAIWGATPSEASALGTASDFEALTRMAIAGGVVGGGVYLALETTLVVKSIRQGMDGHGLPTGWAVFELVWGTAHAVTGALFLAHPTSSSRIEWAHIGIGIAGSLLGLWHMAHGIWSLVEGGPPDSISRCPSTVRRCDVARGLHFDFDVGAVPGGASLRLLGTF